jgi:hypothetical protein
MSMPAADASAVAPAAPAAAPTGAAEPVAAAEPAAVEPVADTPEWADHEKFGWDDWEGDAEGLPEQLQPWYSQFNDRHTKTLEQAKAERQEEIERHEAMARQWRRMYEANTQGDDDPRIAEATEKAATYERAFEAHQEETKAQIEAISTEFQTASDEYFDFVMEVNKEFFDALTPEQSTAIQAAVDVLPLHKAVNYAKLGVLEDAVAIAKEGGNTSIIDRIVQAEKTAATKGRPLHQPSPASKVVAGATPTSPKVDVPEQSMPTDRQSALQMAARRAIAAHARGR